MTSASLNHGHCCRCFTASHSVTHGQCLIQRWLFNSHGLLRVKSLLIGKRRRRRRQSTKTARKRLQASKKALSCQHRELSTRSSWLLKMKKSSRSQWQRARRARNVNALLLLCSDMYNKLMFSIIRNVNALLLLCSDMYNKLCFPLFRPR